MKKILFYSDCIYFSGSENVIVNLLNSEEIKKSFQLCFAFWANKLYMDGIIGKLNSNIKTIPLKLLSNGIILLLDLNKNRNFNQTIYVYILKILQKLLIFDLYNFIRLFILFISIKPDILYINNGGYPGAESCRVAVLSAKLARIRVILFNVNNLANLQTGFTDRLKDRYIAHNVNLFITASKAAKLQLVKNRNFNPAKIINIPNTIPVDFNNITKKNALRREFNIDNDSLIIGSVGLLTKRKGHQVLIEAINIIESSKKIDKKFFVFIFGEGEERNNIASQISKSNLQDKIYLPGYQSNIGNLINDFDIFILPSINQEDFPYVILEAMALGKPIIGTKVAGVPEQVEDYYNGFLVNPNDHVQMAEAICKMINDENKIYVMGQNSRDRFNKLFRYPIIIKQYLDLFEKS
jgi:glycosyltransferase involved in cell wall biosynthesis